MRKTALKKKEKDRHKKILLNRENWNLSPFYNRNGSITLLNHYKRSLFKKEYKNYEYNKDLLRHIKGALGKWFQI